MIKNCKKYAFKKLKYKLKNAADQRRKSATDQNFVPRDSCLNLQI